MILSFTFHNVSINTQNWPKFLPGPGKSLHSTMFLLIRDLDWCFEFIYVFFTFHNVSINTRYPANESTTWRALHSTMFLLIHLRLLQGFLSDHNFTFHNVSINTEIPDELYEDILFFTFHNVSINTQCVRTISWRSFLYIPQCFY